MRTVSTRITLETIDVTYNPKSLIISHIKHAYRLKENKHE